jgi:Zn-dependent peptidase ImmA (M78 family)
VTEQDFRITWEWEPAPGVRTPEHQATWARLEIWAGPDCVTLVEDRASESSRRGIYCPLYPFAEWAAWNWWFLQADARPARALSRYGRLAALTRQQQERHCIRSSNDGFAWPAMAVIPDGDRTHLVWEGDWPGRPDWPVRFLSSGERWVASAEVQRELAVMISAVLTRLTEQGVGPTALAKEWDAIGATDEDEASFCRAAARLGLDPYSDGERYGTAIIHASEVLGGALLTDFLDAVDPDRIEQALQWVGSAQSRVLRPPQARLAGDGAAFQQLRAAAPTVRGRGRGPAWQRGWEDARFVRDQRHADVFSRFEIDDFISRTVKSGGDPDLLALGSGAGAYPIAVLSQRRPARSARFTMARALWNCIWDEAPVFAVTSAYTYRQAVERAFAAELLAPAEGIARLLDSPPEAVSDEELEQIAEHFAVSPVVIEHQVSNQLLTPA